MTNPSTAAKPRATRNDAQRQVILDAASLLFIAKGFGGTNINDIADAVGTTRTALYYYFPSKEAIIQAYYETVQAEQERLCAQAFARTTALRDRLAVAMNSKFDLAQDDAVGRVRRLHRAARRRLVGHRHRRPAQRPARATHPGRHGVATACAIGRQLLPNVGPYGSLRQ